MEPILSCTCNEPEGIVERHVYPFVFSEENIKKFWDNVRKYPKIFGKDTVGDIEDFLDMFFFVDQNGFWKTEHLFFIIDDFVGTLALTNIYHPYDALMHFTFYDGRLKGREELLREMIKYVINYYGFHRLSAEIPCYAPKNLVRFVNGWYEKIDANGKVREIINPVGDKSSLVRKGIGLVLEGRRRKSLFDLKGDLVDVLLYGVTQEDIKEWEPQRQVQLEAELLPL